VPPDTNRIEPAQRPISLGRRNGLLGWTEVGAKYVGVAQSLIVTCRMYGIDPHTSLVDILQRVGQHPPGRSAEPTPRPWKRRFAGARCGGENRRRRRRVAPPPTVN